MAVQEALGHTWVLYDLGLLAAMLICLLTYAVYLKTMAQFQPQNTYEVYDSLGGAQAHVLLPQKMDPPTWNGEQELLILLLCLAVDFRFQICISESEIFSYFRHFRC